MNAIYKVYNPATKRHEEISENAVQIGQQVVKMFWSEYNKQYFTIPGASICRKARTGEMVVVEE